MDLIEYANKFLELDMLIRAVYGGTEKGIYVDGLEDLTWYNIHADIPNWIVWRAGIYKPSDNFKGYVPDVVERLMKIGDKFLFFGFWLYNYDEKYRADGFEYEQY